ncbi:MAG TPA: peptidase domain-containing ABC transporter [Cyclobacteriaceae bacterium]|nr:peptidase domain-containing ABC transporter [Cyclobacteriaceae bacterium]
MSSVIKIKQRDITDCGAACLGSICGYFNLKLSVANLRLLTGTDQRGTTVLGIVEAATQLGFVANGVKGTAKSLQSIPTPAIAHLKRENHSLHYVVICKVDSSHVEIMDPADGELHQLSMPEFLSLWTKVLILLYPSENFQGGNKTRSFATRLFRITHSVRKLLCYSLLTALLYTVLGLSISYYLQVLIDQIIPSNDWSALRQNTIGIFVLLTTSLLIAFAKGKITIRINETLDDSLLLGYCKYLLGLPQSFFDRMKTGEILSRITEAIKIRAFITDILINFTITAAVILIALTLMFTYYWKLGIVILLILPAYGFIFFFTNKLNRKFEKELMENTAAFESFLIESVDKMYTLRISNGHDLFLKKLDHKYASFANSIRKSSYNQLISGVSTESVARYFTLLLLGFGTTLILQGEITTGELFSFYAIVGFFTGPASSLITINRLFQNAKIASERFFEILDLPAPEVRNPNPTLIPCDDIHLQQVNFRYGSRSMVFTNLNLTLHKGQITAVTGPSGSGKSTLAALITKIYPPNAGKILIGTKDIRDINAFDLREQIALIPQRPELFSGSLLENITMSLQPDPARLEMVFHTLGLHEFMKSLPDGPLTQVGEHGIQLSGGQLQLIALARALYKDPMVYILDEATAAMDAGLEEKTLKLLTNLRAAGKTIILITHRLSTLSVADRIVVLRDGSVAEEGTYQELVERKAAFYSMWKRGMDEGYLYQ